MRKPIIYLVIFLLLLVAPSAIRYLQYYRLGGGNAVEPPQYDPANVAAVPTPAASSFVDAPEEGQGLVLLDEAHANQFTLSEISYLDGRLAARGYELLHFTGGDLATALRPVSAFVVVAPIANFDQGEVQAIADFVDRGGHLLMIGDPTRFTVTFNEDDFFNLTYTLETDKLPLNSLANEFDIIFNGDYLYNTSENEGNFRNIILKQAGFGESSLVADMEQVVFYGSHSLQVGPDASALLTADENTWSSATDRPGGLVLGATSREGRVLALGDIHFLVEPYHTVFDNGQLIAHIADFLTQPSERGFILADFPYFYGDSVNLIYTDQPELGADAFDEIIALQDAFRAIDKELVLSAAPQEEQDALYLGIYNQAEDVTELLTTAGITLTIDPPIALEEEGAEEPTPDPDADEEEAEEEAVEQTALIQSSLGNVQMPGTALILLDEEDGRRTIVVLAASNDGLESAIGRLLDLIPLDGDAALSDCLLQDGLALCPTSVTDEVVEAELNTSGIPEVQQEEEGEEEEEENGTGNGDLDEYGAINQGSIGLGETVEGELATEERHSWTFSEGPAVIDITVEGNDEMDGVIELYDPDGNLMESADSTFSGGIEEILGVEIPDDGDYTIVVRDYFDDGGGYTLAVSESGGVGEGGGGIFVFADDDGDALTTGFTNVDTFESLLSEDYEVTVWVSTEDGPLGEDTLVGYDLVIWDSGDYRDEDGFLDEDTTILLAYAEEGGKTLIIGSSPTLFSAQELSAVSDVEVRGDNAALLNGLTEGDVITLDDTYESVNLTDLFTEEDDESIDSFFVRGPNSDNSGDYLGFAFQDPDLGDQVAFLLLPFGALPTDIQETVLVNLLVWFGLNVG